MFIGANSFADMPTVKKVYYDFKVHAVETSDEMSALQTFTWWNQTEVRNKNGKSNIIMDRLLFNSISKEEL